ncbi:a disintegrin-like and metallopeptidase (reprolysin type) with thrombospondin type 1 motif, 14 (predicted) [Rattus norvegicus]|uniref:A disintegrin-like and metallopeptidase (Reprolysin type) with thrombospondin type 1 motif, 14 (Predicted) n=1 Tax=Rattus norvegicus TaxID=10116 RepID=A6K3Z2_RAT|nr:a disintegrin-like and metallopeptidase (reprolysin type) with thrombospondin type 1 motif, 14 (predicted) [Rattus norvegicus]|eukprot:NP_001101106.1 A disintegrin and metalloproteinase with thrombospondin motifs 14 precursor [Rattus norvegicus]
MARLRALLHCLLPWYCALCAAAGSQTPDPRLSGKLHDYVVTVPCSTDFQGRFLSHVVSAPAAASSRSHLRVARSPLSLERETPRPRHHFLYFNVTVFGKLLHLRLQPNRRLVAPGAPVEWQEDFRELFRQPLQRECVYTGGVTGMPGAAVAISNCDGLAGLIRTDNSDFFIEPLERGQQEKEAGGRTHVVYRREAVQREWTEPHGDLHNEAFGLGDLPNVLDLVGDQLGDTERKRRHAKPGSYSIEVLLAVDDSVVRFHGREHTQNYVLTLMNIVDEIYHDESLGAHVNIALVRLIMVGYRQSLSLIERGNPARSLEQVCRWAHSQQRQDPSHTEHHDHVIFLTRQNFGPSGLAWSMMAKAMAVMTRPVWAASWRPWFRLPSTAFIGLAAASWNSAVTSRRLPSRYLLSYNCLLDDPFERTWPQPPELPGIDYSMDEQCRFDFGTGYHTCLAFRTFEPCKQLWCSHPDNPYFCKTKKGPPLDGTECAPGKWCFKGHCVWKSPEQTYGQDGGWSSWTNFGSCSRSCGGGVRSRSRSCDNPPPAYGGRLCSGPMFEYQICNSEDCPGPFEDFRAQQCAKRNSYYTHQDAKHSWLPYEPDSEAQKCELICQSADTGDVVFMNQVVHDGTRCSYRDPYSVCARGECVPFGCDKEVGSMKTDDKCGVCGGDNSHCRTVKGTLGKASKQAAALKQVQIPAGARHIQIELLEKAPRRIAVKNQVTGSFILNPKGKEASSRTFTALGLEWEHAAEDTKDSLKTNGPLPEAIAVLVLPPAEGKPRGSLAYKYVIHEDLLPLIGSNNVLLEEMDSYEWALKSWSPCSKACGGGIQFTKYGCRHRRDHHMVQRHLCDHKKRPKAIRRRCNQHPCPQPTWVTEEWGACSRSCGKLGLQTRGVQCLLPLSNGTHKAMPAKACLGNRPEAKRPCLRVPCPAQWRTGAWSQCSATCGKGIQQRQVVCRNSSSALGPCEGVKPDTVRICSQPACGGDLQNSTVNAEVQDPVTKMGPWEPQSRPLTPMNRISTMEPCVGDRSVFCRMEVLDRYCTIPGYLRLCCESCIKKASSSNASLASLPTFSTPGSLLPEPTATQEDMESTRGPTRLEDHRQSQPTQLSGAVDRISSVTQHLVTPPDAKP